jgi:integrase
MGRKRRRVHQGLPKYVYLKHKSYIYRPYLGRQNGRTVWGEDVYLCGEGALPSEIHAAYERATNERKDTLQWLLDAYLSSPQFKKLKTRTQEDYKSYRESITARPIRGGNFGSVELINISKRTIRNYLDKYKDGKAPIAANRHIQFLKSAWNWGEERFDKVPNNPCLGVKLNVQTPRARYVTPEEFAAFKSAAPSYVSLFMEFAYLCRARWGEVAELKRSDLLPEGVRLLRGKGSEGEITAWTPRLRAAAVCAKAFNGDAPTPVSGGFLIHNKQGRPIRQNAFQTAWGRAMRKWVAAGNERFTFHDLKAAGYSDQKKQDAGHRSDKMHRVYSRKLRVVEPAD